MLASPERKLSKYMKLITINQLRDLIELDFKQLKAEDYHRVTKKII